MKSRSRPISSLRFVLAHHHTFAWGPSHALGDFLKDTSRRLTFFEFPFGPKRLEKATIQTYSQGQLVRRGILPEPLMPEIAQFCWNFVLLTINSLRQKEKFDVFIGVDPLNALAGLILRRLHRVERVTFYAIDFVPHRFRNPIINGLYHSVTKYVAKNVDTIWNMSMRMESIWIGMGVAASRNLVVPTGYSAKEIIETHTIPRDKNTLVFAGSLTRTKGIDLALEAFEELLKVVPDARLLIVGGGPYEAAVRNRISTSSFASHVFIKGYIADHTDMLRCIATGAIGLATYGGEPNSLAWYGDPGRVKEYLALGMPVVITNIPEISATIREERAGIVIEYDKHDLVSATEMLLSDSNLLRQMSINALKLSRRFEYSQMFREAIESN